MKITNVINDYQIFCDLDGVLGDLNERSKELFGIDLDNASKTEQNDFWKLFTAALKKGEPALSGMPVMAGAKKLWDFIEPLGAVVLSATGKTHRIAELQKREFLLKHFGSKASKEAKFCQDGADKANFIIANKKCILIDDRAKAIDPWKAAGGIGILHTSADDTIKQLKQIIK